MLNKRTLVGLVAMLAVICACATPLKMGPPPSPDLSRLTPYHRTAAVYIAPELKSYEYVLVTSPLDKMVYPMGDQTVQLFQQCVPKLFDKVVMIDAMPPAETVDVILKPSLVRCEMKVPMPAYNPYTADVVYRVEVLNPKGEQLFVQTAAGTAQTSKGLLSGFSARSICAEVAQMAMADAAKQIMEGLAAADELKDLK